MRPGSARTVLLAMALVLGAAFLESLTDPAVMDQTALVPASVPSGLPVD